MGGQHQVWPGHFTRVAGPRPDIWQPHCLSLADAQGREGHIKLPSDTMTAGAYSGSNTAGGLQRMSCMRLHRPRSSVRRAYRCMIAWPEMVTAYWYVAAGCSVQVRERVHPVHRS